MALSSAFNRVFITHAMEEDSAQLPKLWLCFLAVLQIVCWLLMAGAELTLQSEDYDAATEASGLIYSTLGLVGMANGLFALFFVAFPSEGK